MSQQSRFTTALRWAALLGATVAASGCAVYPAYPEYPQPVAVAPAPPPGVVYAPAPVYVAPPPVYYPPPVSLSFGFRGYYGGGGRHWHHRR